MAGYCQEADLLLSSDVALPSGTTRQEWIDRAATEIDSYIGARYVLPLTGLTAHSLALLKRINAQLATGRLLTAQAGGDDEVHAYGKWLIDEALASIKGIADGSILLGGAELATTGREAAGGPSVVNQDAYSATGAFEAFAFPVPGAVTPVAPWRPGP